MRRFEILGLIIIVFLLIFAFSFLNKDIPDWKIEVLDLPVIVRDNPLTAQGGLEKAQVLRETEMRITVFQIRDPKGGFILDSIARAWHQRGMIQGYSTLKRDLYFQFKDQKVEIWTSADKFFTVEGEIIIRLLNDDGQIVAETRTEVEIDHQPLLVDEIFKN